MLAGLIGIFGPVSQPVGAETVQELIAEGDRVVAADDGYIEALHRAVALYRRAAQLDPSDPRPQMRAARTYLELGDGVPGSGLAWYRLGEQAAHRALALEEHNADAHYYYAANRGNALEHLPFWKISPAMLSDIERHLLRALALEPAHARALHMMGMFLHKVPAPLRLLLSGTKRQAEGYLTRAVAAEPNSGLLRWDLAGFYRDAGRHEEALEQARAILALRQPTERWAYVHKYRPRAEALLRSLE